MSLTPTILIVEDEKNTRLGLQQFLEAQDYDVLLAENGEQGWAIYQQERPDIVLSDIRMPGSDGAALLERIMAANPAAIVILLTAYGSVEDAVKMMKKGAYYYLTKPVNLEELEFLLKKSLSRRTLEEENRELQQALFREKFDQGDILAHSEKMKSLIETADKIAQSSSTVLIEGESGTGKELIAHRIHKMSPRHSKPFVAVHCAALTETLLASELFGHERGSFTGAVERKIGRFERANGGTLFLDEIGEIPAEMQVKLLRVLQEGEIERVGGTRTLRVDVRIVCATNKNLAEEVRRGKFREDLYYRINVIYLRVPALRERKEDIPLLVDSFIKNSAVANARKIKALTPEAMRALSGYDWPGNIGELKNIIERMVVLSTGDVLGFENIPEDIRKRAGGDGAAEASMAGPGESNLNEVEKQVIARTLAEVKGNKSLAAKKLGISRRTLYRKLDEYGLARELPA
ncbi:MAG: sigma-54 dependent transcriptional regulator [Candidatus Omnitrophota bacterium]|jgi:DNA-binding NtrC family response regulator